MVFEPTDAGRPGEEGVPFELVELYEVLEWENAVADAEGAELPHPEIGLPPPHDPGVAQSSPFVSRAGWGARSPVCVSTNIRPEGTTLHYGGPSPWGSGVDRSSAARFLTTAEHARCATIMRAYQAFHLTTREWCDFAYSSGGCPHGTRYEGRGPGVRTAAQGTNDGNLRSYACVGLWGDGDPLTDPAKLAFLDEGARLARLRWGHRDWKATGCPGEPAWQWRLDGFPRPRTTEEDDMPYTEKQLLAIIEQGVWNAIVKGGDAEASIEKRVEEGVEAALAIRLGVPGLAVDQMHARVRDGVKLALDDPTVQAKLREIVFLQPDAVVDDG
jgi:hypothetical protein